MPETACLHIQARESDPIRVVELPGASVRIGRAPFCEVHLPEPALADEECELRRRGATWHLVPVAAPGAVSIDGRLVDRPRALPYGVPLQVGDFSLTLRPAGANPPDWSAAATATRPAPTATATLHDRLRRAPGTPGPRAATAQREKQLEARWKAAAEQLRSAPRTAVPPTPTPAPAPASAAPIPEVPRAAERLGGWRQADLPRRDAARPAARPLASGTFPSLKTVDAPSAYPRSSARTSATSTIAPTPPAAIPQPEIGAEVEAVFIPPSELDWAEAEATPVVDENIVAPPMEPIAEILVPVVEAHEPSEVDDEPEPAAPVEDAGHAGEPTVSSVAKDVPHPGPGLLVRVGQGIRSLWGRKSGKERSTSEVHHAVASIDPAAAILEPTSEPLAVDASVSADEARGLDDPAPPSLPSTTPDPAPAANVAREHLSPDGRDQNTAEHEATSGSPAPPPEAQPDGERTVDVNVEESPVEAPRRPLFPRRRAKPRTRIPHLGSVRVVPNDETDVPSPDAPTPSRAQMAEDRAASPPEPPPERPRGAEPASFTARTWQADTGPWSGLGASAVTTSTWDAGVGHAGHAVRPPHGHGPAHDTSSNQSWPSARDILAARVAPRTASAPAPKAVSKRPQPTVAHEPEHFTVPLWLGWPPLAASAVGAALLGVALAWTWAQDARTAGVIASNLGQTRYDGKFPLAPEEVPAPAWWRSSGGALARRAAALGRSEDADAEDVRALISVALQASPLEPSARLALARLPARDDDTPVRLKSIGLSRDALALAWTGRQLLKAGQKDSAIRAYHRALELAATADVSRLDEPAYNEDPQLRRYTLPGEDLIGRIVRDMAGHTEWAFDDWAPALPAYAVAPLTAARLLREHDRASSDVLVERLTGDDESRVPPPGTPPAIHFAARAEAFALKREWAQAQSLYQQAIELMPSDRVRRSWQINVADLALRQNDDSARQKALDAANNHDPNDAITLRAVDLQKAPGDRVARTTTAPRDEAVRRTARSNEH